MTEYDRGAYTPHAEAPLAFDPRSPRERRPIPMTLVGSAAVLLVLVAAVVMAYRHGRSSGEAAPRTVGAPVAAVKTIAPPDARPRDPASQLDVYAPQNVAATPAFTAAPEEPAPRAAPAARVQMQAATEPSVRIETPPAPTATTTVTTRTEVAAAPTSTVVTRGAADADAALAPTSKAAPKPVVMAAKPAAAQARTASASSTDATIDAALARSASETRPAKAALATAKPTKSAKIAAAAPAAAHGKAVVQIGAYNSAAIAQAQLAAASAVGGGHGHAVTPVKVGARTLYRTSFTGFADRAAAQAFCARLAASGHACIVKG